MGVEGGDNKFHELTLGRCALLTAEDRKVGSGPGLCALHRCPEPAIPAALIAHKPLT